MKKKHVVLLAGLIVLAAGLAGGIAYKKRNKLVAQVGGYQLFQKDVDYQNRLLELHFPGQPHPNARETLIQGYVRAEVLKANGVQLTDERIKADEQAMRGSLRPGRPIEKILAIFGGDGEGFRRVVVLPRLTQRLVETELFKKSPAQESIRKRAVDLTQAFRKDPKQGQKLAKAANLAFDTGTLTKKNGMRWDRDEERRKLASGTKIVPFDRAADSIAAKEYERWTKSVLGGLSDGEVKPEPFDNGNSWLAIRLVSRKAKTGEVRVEAVKIPKANLQEWFTAQSRKVKVQVY